MNTTSLVRLSRAVLASAAVVLLAACAHPITIEPKASMSRDEAALVPKKVAYVMTDADRQKEVTTPGGGGDKVSYFPYRDLEKSLRDTLRSVYQDVTVLRSATDSAALQAAGVDYVFIPQIGTTSSSPSPFTWPPTKFSVDLTCDVTDGQGKPLAQLRASGNGAAEFEEFKSDFGLAARRASGEAAEKLAKEIRASDKLR